MRRCSALYMSVSLACALFMRKLRAHDGAIGTVGSLRTMYGGSVAAALGELQIG